MAITNSCVAGRDMSRTSKSINLMYDNSHGDIPKDRPQTAEHSKSRQHNTPNYQKYCMYFGLSIVLCIVSNIRMQTKVSNQTTTISISGIVMIINGASPLTMSKKPEQKTNRHAHITRDQTRQYRVYEPVFQKKVII